MGKHKFSNCYRIKIITINKFFVSIFTYKMPLNKRKIYMKYVLDKG